MTRAEVLEEYLLGPIAKPKKGDLYLAVKNHGGDCTVMKCDKNWTIVYAQILYRK